MGSGVQSRLALLLMLCACYSVVPGEEPAADASAPMPGRFAGIDSLVFCGRPGAALPGLVAAASTAGADRDAALYRIVGVFHGCGREEDGVRLLDSLSAAWDIPLDGWAISLLDLGGMSEEALQRASGDPYLAIRLAGGEASAVQGPRVLPAPDGAAETLVRLLLTDPGTLTPDQLKACADLALLFPEAADRLAVEMEKDILMPDSRWRYCIDALAGMGRSDTVRLLAIRRMAAGGSIDESYAAACLRLPGDAAAEAALLLLARGGPGWTASWDVADVLGAAGMTTALAEMVTAAGEGSVTGRGASLALLRALSRHADLLAAARSTLPGDPDSLLARAALFEARALRDLGRGAEAWEAYVRFSEGFPWHPSAHEAAFLAGRYYDGEHMWDDASRAYLTSLRAGGEGAYDESAFWRGGFCLSAAGRTRSADSLWASGCESFPYGFWHDEMLFWRARTAGFGTPAGRSLLEEVSGTHPWEYYGLRARAVLGDEPCWNPRFPAFEPTAAAVALVSEGYGSLAAEMLHGSCTPDTASRIAALSLMGEHRRAMFLCGSFDSRLRYSGTGVVPESVALLQFPAPYLDLALRVTSGLSLEPALVLAIMREESSFDRRVVSGAGARGLIQLMPGTASDVARWYGLPRLEGDDFFDPELSARYGSLYINRQWGSYSGEIPLVLAAYNAGPGNASRWRDMTGYSPADPEGFTELITYRETREYVKKVTRSLWIYRRLAR